MTDRFEDAVRQAAQDLGAGSSAGVPGYEGAWRRGRRRKAVKQAGLACAGALVLIVALGVNAGRLGNSPSDVDDIALESGAATSEPVQTPIATTAPLAVTPTAPPVVVDVPVSPPAENPASIESPSAEAVATPDPAIPAVTAAPTATPAAAVPVAPASTPTPMPTPTVAAAAAGSPDPTSTVDASADDETRTPDPTPGVATALIDPEATTTAAETPTPTPVGTEDGPDNTLPVPVASVPDAVLVGERGTVASPCDLNADGKADATCELFPNYPCTSAADARAGYTTADNNEDGEVDTCRAIVTTWCDSTNDGMPDVPCVITRDDASVEPEAPVDPDE